ncbi:hypothetical protein EON77_04695 [bacterium]|nr:MAG: hypothetical protein EON77_04695 [bacterium]
MTTTIVIERLFEGAPLISPTERRWESGVTFNSSAIRITPREHGHAMRKLLGEDAAERYPDGIVALHYRARPQRDPGFPWTRSFIGLALYTPDLGTLIRRYENPVVSPGTFGDEVDSLGCEDPRVTWIDGEFWICYCGVREIEDDDPEHQWLGSACLARSDDLVNWKKVGAATGTSNAFAESSLVPCDPKDRVSNKDGTLFPDRIDGKAYLLHRPMRGEISTWTTHLASAEHLAGPWTDLGYVNGPELHPDKYEESWVGAGSVPLKVAPGQYLGIAHTGNFLPGMRREYVLDAHLYDFNGFDPAKPETLLVSRLDAFMKPETDFEVHGPFPDSVANVLFCCGSWIYDGWLYWVYGGGDTFTMAARTKLEPLVECLQSRRNR